MARERSVHKLCHGWAVVALCVVSGSLLGAMLASGSGGAVSRSAHLKPVPPTVMRATGAARMFPDSFFPLGFCESYVNLGHLDPNIPEIERLEKRLADLEQIRDGGFNCMTTWFWYPHSGIAYPHDWIPLDYDWNDNGTGDDTDFLNEADSDPNHAIRILESFYDPSEDPNTWRDIVDLFKGHAALWTWGTYDDVDGKWAYRDNDPNDPNWCPYPCCLDPNTPHAPATVNAVNGEVRQADLDDPNDPSSRLNYTCIGGGCRTLFIAYNACDNVDWVYYYYYPIGVGAQIRSIYYNFSDVISGFPTHPVVAVLQMFPWACIGAGDPNDPRSMPTPAEVRNMTYQALCAGAAGVLYYAFNEYWEGSTCVDLGDLNDPNMAALWNELTTIAAELNGLNAETLRPLFSDVMRHRATGDIRWAYWVCYDPNDMLESELYTIAVNVREDTLADYAPVTGVQLDLPVPCNSTGQRLDGDDPNDPWPLGPCSDPNDPDFHAMPELGVYVYKFRLPILRGDMNCDGSIDYGDLAPFALALADAATWMDTYRDCSLLNGDRNGDGVVDLHDTDPKLLDPCYADMDCDGDRDFGDINPFVQALSDPYAWKATYPVCSIMNGDVNNDGSVNVGDINPFVALLASNPLPMPCP